MKKEEIKNLKKINAKKKKNNLIDKKKKRNGLVTLAKCKICGQTVKKTSWQYHLRYWHGVNLTGLEIFKLCFNTDFRKWSGVDKKLLKELQCIEYKKHAHTWRCGEFLGCYNGYVKIIFNDVCSKR